MSVFLGRTITRDFVCHTPTGAISNADSTPICEVFEDTTDTAILTPTPVLRSGETGQYRVQVAVTAGNGFEIGKSYNVTVTAIVNGVTSKAVIASFEVEQIALKTGAVVTDAGNTATLFKTDLSESVNDVHKDGLVLFTSGNLINQVKKISAYNGTTKVLTANSAFTETPSVGDKFIVLVW